MKKSLDRKKNHSVLKAIGELAQAAVVAGVIANIHDIKRHIELRSR
jgi:hypothetical protein